MILGQILPADGEDRRSRGFRLRGRDDLEYVPNEIPRGLFTAVLRRSVHNIGIFSRREVAKDQVIVDRVSQINAGRVGIILPALNLTACRVNQAAAQIRDRTAVCRDRAPNAEVAALLQTSGQRFIGEPDRRRLAGGRCRCGRCRRGSRIGSLCALNLELAVNQRLRRFLISIFGRCLHTVDITSGIQSVKNQIVVDGIPQIV